MVKNNEIVNLYLEAVDQMEVQGDGPAPGGQVIKGILLSRKRRESFMGKGFSE